MAINRCRRKTKRKVPVGYDSCLEYDLHNNELDGWNYHPTERVSYAVPSTYEPDFVTEVKWNEDCICSEGRCTHCLKTILVEVKGRFRTRQEATKYIYVRQSLEEETNQTGKEQELIFLFQDAKKAMPFAGKRKDGTKQSHGEWATKNSFTYYCLKEGLPASWLAMV